MRFFFPPFPPRLRIVVLLFLCGTGASLRAAEDESIDFTRDIRPILSDKCFHCHGPDGAERKGDLRLDTREGLLESGTVQPGNPKESELVARILTDDESDVMPPPKSKLKLSAEEIEQLSRWIEEGAEYRGHWAFEPIPSTA